jgi:hypothetical protein
VILLCDAYNYDKLEREDNGVKSYTLLNEMFSESNDYNEDNGCKWIIQFLLKLNN